MLRHMSKHFILTVWITSMLLVVPVTLAAQETTTETTTGPSGLMVLAFLLGMVGILIVGIATLARDSFKSDDEPQS